MDNLGRLFDLANLNVHGVVGADVNIASLAQLIASGNFLQQRSAESGSTVLQFNLLDSVGQRLAALQNVADVDNLGRLFDLANLNVHGVVGADVNIASLAQLIACGNLLQQRGAESGSISLKLNLLDFSIQSRTALQNVADIDGLGGRSRLRSLGKACILAVSFCQILKVNGIIAIQIADTIAAEISLPVVAIRQLRSFLIRRCSNVNVLNYLTILISKRDMNGFYCCKRRKRYAHDNHERGRQQSKQTSFEIRFLHVKSPIL